MRKKIPKRLYFFSDANLITMVKEKIAYLKRDAVIFSDYGIIDANIIELENLNKAFSDLVTDKESAGNQVAATQFKDAKAEELRNLIRDVMTRVAQKFGEQSSQYRIYGIKSLSKQRNANLIAISKKVVRIAKTQLKDLKKEGLTATMIDQMAATALEFEDLLIDQKLVKSSRDIDQEDRVEAGNEIYFLLKKYAKTGKDIWVGKDTAKYNDYVIYKSKSRKAEESAEKES